MNAAAPPADPDRRAWLEKLRCIGRREGFFEELGADHTALYVARGDTLIVTFENLDHVFEHHDNRMPWGHAFVSSQGWSMLGLMAHGWTWYRDPAVFAFFDYLAADGFFAQFRRVVFYGASMGAYAACAFSAAAPGATVIAISPQATLDRTIAPWERRYRAAWRRDFTGAYGYAPAQVQAAHRVHLFHDPAAPLDAMHATLFDGPNVAKYACRFAGHRIASLWMAAGILKPVVMECVDGTLTPPRFYRMARARRDVPRYQRDLLDRARAMGRDTLAARYCEAVLARREAAPYFAAALEELRGSAPA